MKSNIIEVDFNEALSERYLAYALSTIMSRSLPDARDGLKPVHRRLLYSMLQLRLNPGSAYKKCARVVGDVMGKYHPHGDVAIYNTLVRLAQDFSVRYPLIDGQGNFGSIDGDNAAAMRYTEAKLTDIAMLLLEDIDKETVEFRPNYDGQEVEPEILPASFPNLLANGAEGIAVGMATSIPPHNIMELLQACLALLKNPNLTSKDLIKHVIGPDFPTGGVMLSEPGNMEKIYASGRGSVRLRAKWHKEELSHGNYQIIITEIPYQVQKSRLLERIAELFKNKRLVLLGDIMDESAEDMRIVLEPKSRNVNANMLMESLYKLTELETRVNFNMNALNSNSVPKVMGLKELLTEFLDHRKAILIRRCKFRLGQIDRRLEILSGLLIAYLNLDEVIKIIRNEDDPKPIIMKKWKLSDLQAESILNMKLRSLRKLEEIEIKKESEKLNSEKEELKEVLSSEKNISRYIAEHLKRVKSHFQKNPLSKRKTAIEEAEENTELSIEAFVEKEDITVTLSKQGWIKSYRGHLDAESLSKLKYKEGDNEGFIVNTSTHNSIILLSSLGKAFTIQCDKIPKTRGDGHPISILIELGDGEYICSMFSYDPAAKLFIASDSGKGFIVEGEELLAQKKSGKLVMNLKDKEVLSFCKIIDGSHIALIGTNRKLLIYPVEEIPIMKKGSGVRLQKYKEAKLNDVQLFDMNEGLRFEAKAGVKIERDLKTWLGKRGDVGKIPPRGFPKNNKFFG